ncbi:MAG: putative RNA-binding protein, contains TRAM domain protein [uncultured archaeon A07HR67]|nr:MAG: putative RNA-binding protein, contains TRAM domain protein [uncultured archaeon A07HR67]
MMPTSPLVVGAVAVVGLLLAVAVVRRARGPSADARESKRAHETAQDREPPVAIGETYELGVTELTDHHSGSEVAVGKVEGFVVFTADVPSDLSAGDVIRARVLSFNEGRTSADATFVTKV